MRLSASWDADGTVRAMSGDTGIFIYPGYRFKVLDVETAEHKKRAMLDGQIDNIRQVAELARQVTQRLEERLDVTLERVCVAAAGRALVRAGFAVGSWTASSKSAYPFA